MMKIKLATLAAVIVLLALAAMVGLSVQANRVENRLIELDKTSQAERLMQISMPRVQGALSSLLRAIRAGYTEIPELNANRYPGPDTPDGQPVAGHFLLTPYELKTPVGEENARHALENVDGLLFNLKRKTASPSARLLDPNAPVEKIKPGSGLLPVFDVVPIVDADPETPIRVTGEPTPFFAWSWGGWIIYMRQIPTNHGGVSEGVLIAPDALAEHLLPLVEKGISSPVLRIPDAHEQANLLPLPLLLEPGGQIQLPDTSARKKAVFGAILSAWVVAVVAILMILGLLALYGRLERRRSDFVSAVTHELRTPLTTFTLHTEMLKAHMVPEEKKEEYYNMLHQESLRLAHLVENVLAFSRLSRGKSRGRQDVEACEPLFTRLFNQQKEKLETAGFKVSIAIAPQCRLLQVRTDVMSLERILTNLTDNVIKYGRGTNSAVQFTVQANHKEFRVRVRDKGPGIAPEAVRRLFRPFSRSADTVGGKKPGVGLGLALSRDLARSIGGDLMLEGTSPQGCTFLLTLPAGKRS